LAENTIEGFDKLAMLDFEVLFEGEPFASEKPQRTI